MFPESPFHTALLDIKFLNPRASSMKVVWLLILVLLIVFINRTTPSVTGDKWWERGHAMMAGAPSYWEAFANPAPLKKEETDSPLTEYPPNGPHPAEVYTEHPYHLLSDSKAAAPAALSNTNSRSCYETDFEQATSKTGNFIQRTNNYKRDYPDSCSGWNQELTMNFYQS